LYQLILKNISFDQFLNIFEIELQKNKKKPFALNISSTHKSPQLLTKMSEVNVFNN